MACLLPKETVGVLPKLTPVIVTSVLPSAGPLFGEIDVIAGPGVVKRGELSMRVGCKARTIVCEEVDGGACATGSRVDQLQASQT